MWQRLNTWLLHRVLGWRVEGDFPRELKKYLLLGGPHTSNADFVMAMILIWSKGVEFKILGKQELFTPWTGWLFRWLGVVPVNRQANTSFVAAAAQWIKASDELVIALSPEGTRKRVTRLRSGFYHLAKAADVPVVMIGADFPTRRFVITAPHRVGEDAKAEMERVWAFFEPFTGKVAERSLRR